MQTKKFYDFFSIFSDLFSDFNFELRAFSFKTPDAYETRHNFNVVPFLTVKRGAFIFNIYIYASKTAI